MNGSKLTTVSSFLIKVFEMGATSWILPSVYYRTRLSWFNMMLMTNTCNAMIAASPLVKMQSSK